MNYLYFAYKNLKGRMTRTLLTASGVALAVFVATTLLGFNKGHKNAIEESIEQLGFQVMIMAKGCPYEAATMMLKGGTGLLYLPQDIYKQVTADENVKTITPLFVGLATKESISVLDDEKSETSSSFTIVTGIDLESYRQMKPWLKFTDASGRWFHEENLDEIVLGYEVAEYESRKVGDLFYMTITPNGSVTPQIHKFKITGILERTGSQDDGAVYLPLKRSQELFNRNNELTIIGVKLKEFNGPRMREFEGRWLALPEVQVVSLQQVKGALLSLIETAQTVISAVAIIAIIVAVIGVLNSILMSVFERIGEIGIMKAIFATNYQIFKLIFLETLMLTMLGLVMGLFSALILSQTVDHFLQKLLNMGVRSSMIVINFETIFIVVVGTTLLGLIAGFWPSFKASRMAPVEAIRKQE